MSPSAELTRIGIGQNGNYRATEHRDRVGVSTGDARAERPNDDDFDVGGRYRVTGEGATLGLLISLRHLSMSVSQG